MNQKLSDCPSFGPLSFAFAFLDFPNVIDDSIWLGEITQFGWANIEEELGGASFSVYFCLGLDAM